MGQYNAFISYSHAADGRLAPAVQAALERLAKPWYRRRALRIFRDNTGLSVNPALWSSIKVAMDESEYFLLFASPEAAESEWVNKELTHWKAEKPVDHILPIVSDGTWVWDSEAHDFDWERSTAVPAALGGVFAEEPRHLDLSWARSETHLNRRHARFRDAIAQLGAPIHGRTKDELEGEDIRQHKRTIRLAWGAAVTLTVLAVAAIVGASLAVANANRAEQRRIASRSRELAARAENFQDRDLDLAVLLAAEGFRLDETAEARTALLTGLQRSPGLERIVHWPNANVSEVAFSPDGRTLATAASESTAGGIVWLSDLETGTDINGALSGIKGSATSAAWAPDGTTLATGADSGQVLIWDLANEGPRADANAGAPVNAVAYSADSRLVISGATDGTVEFWNVEDGTPLTNPIDAHSEEITSAATGPGSLAVTGSLDGTIRLWDLDTLAPTGPPIKARDTTVNSVAVSPDGATIAVGGSEGTIELWATEQARSGAGEPRLLTGHESVVDSLAFRPNGKVLASGSWDRSVRLWAVEEAFPIGEPLDGHGGLVQSVAFSPDGKTLASSSSDATVRLWEVGPELLGNELVLGAGSAQDLAFVEDAEDNTLMVANEFGPVLEWNVDDRELRNRYEGGRATGESVAVTRDGAKVAAGLADGSILVWDGPGSEPGTIMGDGSRVEALAFDPTGNRIAAGSWNNTITIYDSRTLEAVGAPLAGHEEIISDVEFSPDGAQLASAGFDGTVRLWDSAKIDSEPSAEAVFDAHDGFGVTSIAFSPDGTKLASGGQDRRVEIRDTRSGELIGEPLAGHADDVTSVAFGPDGSMLASASLDATAIVWDVEDQLIRAGPFVADSGVLAVAISPDGRLLAVGDEDDDSRIWNIDTNAMIERACMLANRNLSELEWDQFIGDEEPMRRTCPDLPDGTVLPKAD